MKNVRSRSQRVKKSVIYYGKEKKNSIESNKIGAIDTSQICKKQAVKKMTEIYHEAKSADDRHSTELDEAE